MLDVCQESGYLWGGQAASRDVLEPPFLSTDGSCCSWLSSFPDSSVVSTQMARTVLPHSAISPKVQLYPEVPYVEVQQIDGTHPPYVLKCSESRESWSIFKSAQYKIVLSENPQSKMTANLFFCRVTLSPNALNIQHSPKYNLWRVDWIGLVSSLSSSVSLTPSNLKRRDEAAVTHHSCRAWAEEPRPAQQSHQGAALGPYSPSFIIYTFILRLSMYTYSKGYSS